MKVNSNAAEKSGPAATERVGQIYTVSVAAELAGMHAQTLRQYDRLGLVSPQRAKGRGRRYSSDDVRRLVEIQSLTQEQGVNLAGVALILELRENVQHLKSEIERLRGVISSTSTPTSRVFTADTSGDVRQRPPVIAASDVTGSPSPLDSPDGVLSGPIPVRGKSIVSASTAFGWQKLAALQLARVMQRRGEYPPYRS